MMLRGLGQDVSTILTPGVATAVGAGTVAAGTVATNFATANLIPSYCSWLPFSSFLDSCKPPTPDQQLANDLANIGPAASPESIATLQEQWAQTNAAECAADPTTCTAYQFATQNPTISAIAGTGPLAQYATGAANAAANLAINWGPMLVLIGGGIAIFFAMQGVKR